MPAPERTPDQRRAALLKANRVRVRRAELKRRLRGMPSWAARREARQIILNPPEQCMSMTLFDLLLTMPKWGRVKVNRLVVKHRISPSKTLGGLSERQRGEIVGALRDQ